MVLLVIIIYFNNNRIQVFPNKSTFYTATIRVLEATEYIGTTGVLNMKTNYGQ